MGKDFDPVEYGWKVHDALDAWTSKVDAKASIVLAVETAVMGLVVTLAESGRPLGKLTGSSVLPFRAGICVLLLAIVLAGASVIPQLRRQAARREWRTNSIYFGHLRHWTPGDLVKRLEHQQADSSLEELARQHVRMAQIAWRKHSCLQVSMLLVPVGSLSIFFSAT